MKIIKIENFQLSEPKPADYNHNSEFKQSFGNDPKLKLISFPVPDDAFELSRGYWELSIGTGEHFIEFNKIFNGVFQTIILLDPGFDINLTYHSKEDRIIELLNEIKSHQKKINNLQKEIEKLT